MRIPHTLLVHPLEPVLSTNSTVSLCHSNIIKTGTYNTTIIRIRDALPIDIRSPQFHDGFRASRPYTFEVAEVSLVGCEDVGEGVEVLFGDLTCFVFYEDVVL